MKAITLAVALIVLASPLSAQNVKIDHDAIGTQRYSMEELYFVVALINLYGYQCESLSQVHEPFWGEGYNVICDRWRYDYEIRNKGGQWSVAAK